MVNTSHTSQYFCCNRNCTNCRFKNGSNSINKQCMNRLSKKICHPDNYKNGYHRLGQKAWNTYNIQYGHFPEHLKCFCRTAGKNCKMKTFKSCDCSHQCVKLSAIIRKKLSENKSYMKVMNPYGDINYNTVDGWPPIMATPSGDHYKNLNIDNALQHYDSRLHKYMGKIYGYRDFVEHTFMCGGKKITRKTRVCCIPSAVRI